MSELNLKAEQKIESVENFEFEPIKGQPMLNWRGKRPFTSTQFYPAQLKESFGEETDGWMNKIFWGDNLQVMSHLLKQYRGQVDLIYIDPPFDSKADYKKKIELRGKKAENDKTAFEEKQYTDIWSNDEYLQFMYERLIIMRELLSDTGSIYLHCDWHKSHLLRMILDEVFGPNHCRNEIVWYYRRWTAVSNSFQKMHDTILYYSKSDNVIFNPIYIDSTEGQQKKHERGYDRNSVYINGVRKPQLLIYDEDKTKKAISEGQINISEFARIVHIEKTKTIAHDVWDSNVVNSFTKVYIRDVDRIIDDVWQVNYLNSQSIERVNYPTQKPISLLERVIEASSNPGDLIFDCFMGSGTTQVAAMKMGRRFIGADINLGAIDTTVKRLNKVAKEINEEIHDESQYTGFEVWNVNNYDVFRNPVQAKDLLIEALELQPLPDNSLYDGEKDGRMVKIMPINRYATRVDLNELINGFPRDKFEKRKAETPNKPVELVTLVCMGHEPDLGANLKYQLNEEGYNIDVEVVDILRDKINLEFRRDSEADVQIEGDRLVIREFYPMNLLQKLSLEKTNVNEWRELVDSIKIDFNFDGAVFSPTIIDIPEGSSLVKGSYKIPDDAGTIKVKITDLLSEACEVTINA